MTARLRSYVKVDKEDTEKCLLYINDQENMCLKISIVSNNKDEAGTLDTMSFIYYIGTGGGLISRIRGALTVLIHGSLYVRDIKFSFKDLARIKGFINEKTNFSGTKTFYREFQKTN